MTHRAQQMDLMFIGVVSGSILAYELLLTRILAVHYWSYFASMIVSLAMLGFAASGTALFLCARTRRGTAPWVPWMTGSLAVAVPVCPRLSELIDCMPLVVLWNPHELLRFAGHYLLLAVPFFLGGFVVGHFFLGSRLRAGRVYCANMLGSGAGVLIGLMVFCRLRPFTALCLAALPVLAFDWLRASGGKRRLVLPLLALPAVAMAWAAPGHLGMSEYKGMSKLMLMPDAEVEHEDWNRFGYLSVVGSRTIRYAPGLSLMYPGSLPAQKAIFMNGDDMEAVCRGAMEANARRSFFGSMLSGLTYRFHAQPRVLVAGAGGGMDVLSALSHGASRVDALENNTAMIELMTGPLSGFSGGLYDDPRVHLIADSARAYVNRTTNRYDVVLVPAKRSLFASSAGTSAQDPDYLLTSEAVRDFHSVLAPGGVLSMETWLNLPPRHSLKLFATAAHALSAAGMDARSRLMSARSLRTSLLLVFRDPLTPEQSRRGSEFCAGHAFDRVYDPFLSRDDVNRFNLVEGAPYFELSRRLLDTPQRAYAGHLYRIRPATDDRPYFSHFFKWAALPQLLAKTGRNVAVHVGWAYMFLLITLAQAVPLGVVIILGPLAAAGRARVTSRSDRWRVYTYFSALGFGFMFLELAAIQQFARFLPHPVYAFGVTIGLVLVCSGLGALVAGHAAVGRRPVFVVLLALIVMHIGLWRLCIGTNSEAVFYVDMAAVAVLAFFMGMPFPRGVERLRASAPWLVPWAWGINGFVSVIAVLAAGLVSLSWGLTVLVALAAACYLVAAFSEPA